MYIYIYIYMRDLRKKETQPPEGAYVGNPRSEETIPNLDSILACFMNSCSCIRRNPRGLPVALAK